MIYEYLLLINTMIINFKIFMNTKNQITPEEEKRIINRFGNGGIDETELVKDLKNYMS